jgi:predicted aldo/keto reductase-like oxidoreductase
MQYREFGRLDWKVSVLGYGCLRFPTVDGDYERIDEEVTVELIRAAIDQGVNYLDTAYDYNRGSAERVIGKALLDGYRNRVRLATKLPCASVHSAEDFDRYLNEQLDRLQTDHVDVYLLHRLNTLEQSWPKMRDLGVFEWAEGAIADGRIGCLGFSFHDAYDVFQEIVDAYDGWSMCQIQYNYMDIQNQAGTRGLQYAASKGLAVVIMEPLLGGKLANPPQPVQALWDTVARQRSPAEWGLQWLWNQPEVSVVLSGMNEMQHLKENIASASSSGVGTLTQGDLALVNSVRERYRQYRGIPCTQCRYCMPCPNGVDIPWSFYFYNRGLMHDDVGYSRTVYSFFVPEGSRASACIQCRQCEPKCSQRIPISEWMPKVHAVLSEGEAYP